MGSFRGLGIGLSFLFGCFLLGVIAQLYYLLWWKKKFTKSQIGTRYGSNKISSLFCWRQKPINSVGSSQASLQELNASVKHHPEINVGEPDLELGGSKDSLLKGYGEESMESELMRLHNLCGPPRFLFTINEETKEDLESEDAKSRGDRSRKGSRTRSLSDLLVAMDTPPFLTPLSSPPVKIHHLDSYSNHGFNPLFESSMDAEYFRLRSSPPPKFKFLRDAEEKLIRRLVEEAERRVLKNGGTVQESVAKAPPLAQPVGEKDDCFVARAINKTDDTELHYKLQLYHSAPSQVLPLASSPSTFRPLDSMMK